MREFRILVGLLLVLGPIVVAQKPDDQIAKVRATWVDDFKTKNADGLASLYVDNATLVAASGERIVGKENIRHYFVQLFESVATADVSVDSKDTGVSGELGYDSGVYDQVVVRPGTSIQGNVTLSGSVRVSGGGSPVKSHGSYLVVLSRKGGKWLIVQQASVDMSANSK